MCHHFLQEGIHLEYNDDLIEYLVKDVENLKLGARPIKNKIRAELESKIADVLIGRRSEKVYLNAGLDDVGELFLKEHSLVHA